MRSYIIREVFDLKTHAWDFWISFCFSKQTVCIKPRYFWVPYVFIQHVDNFVYEFCFKTSISRKYWGLIRKVMDNGIWLMLQSAPQNNVNLVDNEFRTKIRSFSHPLIMSTSKNLAELRKRLRVLKISGCTRKI